MVADLGIDHFFPLAPVLLDELIMPRVHEGKHTTLCLQNKFLCELPCLPQVFYQTMLQTLVQVRTYASLKQPTAFYRLVPTCTNIGRIARFQFLTLFHFFSNQKSFQPSWALYVIE